MSNINLTALMQLMDESYNLDDLQTLFILIGEDYENFSGDNKLAKIRSLLLHMRRYKRLPELVQTIADQMPHLDMTPFGATPPTTSTSSTSAVVASAEPEREFINFDLRVYNKQGDNIYPVEASHNYRGGAGTGTVRQSFDLNDREFKDLFLYLKELVAEPEDTKAFGLKLRQLLFPSQVWSLFNTLRQDARRDGKGVRIRLRIDPPELSSLPWEYCYDGESRVFFAKHLSTPLVRYFQRPYTPDALETNSQLRILMVMAEPKNVPPLNMDKEEKQLREILGEFPNRVQFSVLKNATPYELQRRVAQERPHVIHFVGHGEFRDGEGALLLEDDDGNARRLNAEQMADLLRDRGVKLVVLNACETAASAEGDAFMGVAPSLVLADIPAVIAMQFSVPDTTAIRFSRALYDYLTLGKPLDTAVTEMRISASNGSAPEDQVFWAIPVLFMRSPDGVIWKTNNRRPVSRGSTASAASGGSTTPVQEIPPTAAPAPQLVQTTQSNTGSGGINISSGGDADIDVSGDIVSGDKVTTTNITNIVGGGDGPSLAELVDQLAVDIRTHLPNMDEFDADDLKDYIEDAQKLVSRDRFNRAATKLEDAADLIEDLDDNALEQKVQQAIAIAKSKG